MRKERREFGDEMTTCPDKNCLPAGRHGRDKSQYVADASTGSKEFLDEQLYQVALRGGYSQEFNQVQAKTDSLKAFQTAGEFMKALWNDKPLREGIIRQLKQLWLADYAFRPNSGLVLMLAMWRNAIGAGDDFWGDLFIRLGEEAQHEI